MNRQIKKSMVLAAASTILFSFLSALDIGGVAKNVAYVSKKAAANTLSMLWQQIEVDIARHESLQLFPDLPGDITLNDARVLAIVADKKITLQGTVSIFGVHGTGLLYLHKAEDGTAAYTIVTGVTNNVTLESIIPSLAQTAIGGLTLDAVHMTASNSDYTDEQYGLIKAGLGLRARVRVEGALEPLRKLMPSLSVWLQLSGTILSATSMHFAAEIGEKINFSSGRLLGGSSRLEIIVGSPRETAIILAFSVMIRPTPEDAPLEGVARLKIGVLEASGSLSLKGQWINPLGFRGISLGNLAGELGINYLQFAASGVPSAFAVTGELRVGTTIVRMGAKLTVDVTKVILHGGVHNLALRDFVALADTICIRIPPRIIPPLVLHEISLYLAPEGGSIGEFSFKPGLSAIGNITLGTAHGRLTGTIDYSGLVFDLDQNICAQIGTAIDDFFSNAARAVEQHMEKGKGYSGISDAALSAAQKFVSLAAKVAPHVVRSVGGIFVGGYLFVDVQRLRIVLRSDEISLEYKAVFLKHEFSGSCSLPSFNRMGDIVMALSRALMKDFFGKTTTPAAAQQELESTVEAQFAALSAKAPV